MNTYLIPWLMVTPAMTVTAVFLGCALIGLFAWIEMGVAECIGVKEACIFAAIDVAIILIAGLMTWSMVGHP